MPTVGMPATGLSVGDTGTVTVSVVDRIPSLAVTVKVSVVAVVAARRAVVVGV